MANHNLQIGLRTHRHTEHFDKLSAGLWKCITLSMIEVPPSH